MNIRVADLRNGGAFRSRQRVRTEIQVGIRADSGVLAYALRD
jgi:hypothetical protein